MKTSLGKVATVVTASVAIAIAGVTVALLLGGPNWLGIAQSIDGYSFTFVGGENPTWTASNDETAATVKSAPVLADTIPPVLQEKITAINSEADALAQRRQLLEGRLEVAKQTSVTDKTALAARLEELRGEIATINQQASKTAADVLSLNEQIAQVETTIEARRGDVYRSEATVKALDADIKRAKQLRQQLADLIVQIDGDLARAAEREQQLQDILGQSGS